MSPVAHARGNDDDALVVEGALIVSDAYHQVKTRLRDLVASYAAQGRYKLPPEDQLGAALGVSRPTIRSALLSLQKEGKVQRFHGRGTFINRYALDLSANISEDRPFIELIAALGHEATLRTISISRVTLPERVTDRLELEAGAHGVTIERVFEADGKPAVFSIDWVAQSLLTEARGGAVDDELDAGSSTFEFLESSIGRGVQYSVAELRPTLPPRSVHNHLGLSAKSAVLLLSHLHVDAAQRPIAVTEAYLNDAIIRFSVVRTYLDS